MANEQRVIELKIDASGAEAGSRLLALSFDHLGEAGTAATAKIQAGLASQTQSLSRLPVSIDSIGAALDRVRAKTDTVFGAQLKQASDMTKAYGVLNRAIITGLTTEQDAANQIAKLRAQQIKQLDAVRDAQERTNVVQTKAANQNHHGLSEGNRAFIGRDIAFQAQDVLTTAVGGMSPKTIALQQGTQIAGAVSGLTLKETGSALVGAVANLANPVSLAAIAFTGLAAAGIQYFIKAKDGALSLDAALKANADTLTLLKGQYGDLAKISTNVTSVAGGSFVLADARSKKVAIDATMRDQLGGYVDQVNDTRVGSSVYGASAMTSLKGLQDLKVAQPQFAAAITALLDKVKSGKTDLAGFTSEAESLYQTLALSSKNPEYLRSTTDAMEVLAQGAFTVSGKFKPFEDAINQLKVQGAPGLAKFTDEVHRLGQEKGIGPVADELISKGNDIVQFAQQAATLQRALQAIDKEDTRPGLADRNNLQGYVARRGAALDRTNEQFDASQQMSSARTFSERLAAVRAQSLAQQPSKADEGGGAQARADRAVTAELNDQTNQLADAQRSRAQSLQDSIKGQQQEINLIGKTGGEVAKLRTEYQLFGQIRAEAAKNRLSDESAINLVYGKEMDTVRQLSAEVGRLTEARARAQIANDNSFQRDQFGRSAEGRTIADQQRSAGLPVDLLSKQAFDTYKTNRLPIDQDKGYARDAFNAQNSGLKARSPAELGAAARAAASAQHNQNEPDDVRRQRIDNAANLAQAQAQNGLDEAAKERKRSLDQSIASQQLELTTIGKSGGEVAALRMQYQLTAQVQAEAAKNNITVSQNELDLIKQKSAEYGRLADQIAKASLHDDLQFERDQLYRSPADQQIASRQRGSGQAVDLNSPDAQFMKQTAMIDSTRTSIKGFFTDFSQQLQSNGGKAGEAFGSALKTALLNQVNKLQDAAFSKISSFLTDLLLGKSSSTPGAAGAGTAVDAAAKIGASALGAASSGGQAASTVAGTGVAAQAWNFFASKGLQPHQIAGVLGNMSAESSFNPKAVGDGGSAFGLFQNHADRGGGSDLLASGATGQLEHAWTELQGPENKAFKALMSSTDVKGATAAFAGFERPQGFSWSNPQGADNFSGRLSAANDALATFGKTTGQATQGVSTLGNGLGQLGTSLASGTGAAAASASGGGGGLFGWLGSLFSSSSVTLPTGSNIPIPTQRPFADGGFTGHGGVNDPAGIVHRGEVVWSQRDVARAGGVAAVEGMRLGYRGYAGGGPVDVPPIRSAPANSNGSAGGNMKVDVGVSVDDDGKLQGYVKNIAHTQASQVSQQNIADYREAQRRGEFGAMQSKWVSQRG